MALAATSANAGNHHYRHYDEASVSGFDNGNTYTFNNLSQDVYSKYKDEIAKVDAMREDCIKKKQRMISLKRSGAHYTEIKAAVYDYKMAERNLGLAYRDLNMKINGYYN